MYAFKLLVMLAFIASTNAIIFSRSRFRHAHVSRLPLWGRRNRAIVWDEEKDSNNAKDAKDVNDFGMYDYDYDYEESDFRGVSQSNKMKDIFKPRTPKQKEYYNDINNDELSLVIATGPAGTGKTLFPTQYAAKLLLETDQKIILTRPLISVDEELGYLPGTINQKMDPWIIPIFDVLREFFPQKTLNTFIAEKRLEIVPLAFMRGRTFKDTFIIGDELQNTSNKQMLMLLTRLGENSKLIITGDIHQCDNTENGLLDLLKRIHHNYDVERNDNYKEQLKSKLISTIDFDISDIQRSAIITTILELYEPQN